MDVEIKSFWDVGSAPSPYGTNYGNLAAYMNGEQMTYSVAYNSQYPNGIFNINTRNFAKKMTAFNDYWIEQQRTLLGLQNNIDLFSTWVSFFDADDPCYSVLMTYAGFPYYFGE